MTTTTAPSTLDVEALLVELTTAWNAGDPSAVAATFTADGRLVDPLGVEHDGRPAVEAAYAAYFGGILSGTRTEVRVDSVRELAPGLVLVDAWQTFTGPLPRMHLTAVVRHEGDEARMSECRPYILLELPGA